MPYRPMQTVKWNWRPKLTWKCLAINQVSKSQPEEKAFNKTTEMRNANILQSGIKRTLTLEQISVGIQLRCT